MRQANPLLLLACLVGISVGGCRASPVGMRPGAAPEEDLLLAYRARDERLLEAIARSLAWFDTGASHAYFPDSRTGPRADPAAVTHARARASVVELRRCLLEAADERDFAARVAEHFDVCAATGGDGANGPSGAGPVQFTAYYAPECAASRDRSGRFRFPLYAPPPGWTPGAPWHPRHAIEDGDLLAGREIAWLEDALDVYLVQVNGSALLRLAGGGVMRVGHAGTNELAYTSLGRLLVEEGLADESEMSIATIQGLFETHPDRVTALMRRNDRFVFFEELAADAWPRSALGIPLTPGSSLAADKSVFPPGVVTLVRTTLAGGRPYVRFMLDQDAGGAITGPGRADLYLGVGEEAGRVAGAQRARGRLYYLIVRH